MYRRSLEHEGELLEAGEKHILSLNLWAFRNRTLNQVLHITFPPTDAGDDAPTPAEADARTGEALES